MTGEAARRAVEMWRTTLTAGEDFSGERLNLSNEIPAANPKKLFAGHGTLQPEALIFICSRLECRGFAVASVSKELKKITFVVNNATEFTADPKVRSPYAFRKARNNLLDNIVSAQYAAKKSKEFSLKRWYTHSRGLFAGQGLSGFIH